MDQRIYHGNIHPEEFSQALIAHFNRGNYRVQQIGEGDQLAVQIATNSRPTSGGQTAVSINLQQVEDGVSIQVGNQAWYGVAASLSMTALAAFRNPFSLLGRLDDIAQDIESMQLVEQIWSIVDATARASGVSTALSERLRRCVCSYCDTPNPVGEPNCIACGAPLGGEQPRTCLNCGFVVKHHEMTCPNCGRPLLAS